MFLFVRCSSKMSLLQHRPKLDKDTSEDKPDIVEGQINECCASDPVQILPHIFVLYKIYCITSAFIYLRTRSRISIKIT